MARSFHYQNFIPADKNVLDEEIFQIRFCYFLNVRILSIPVSPSEQIRRGKKTIFHIQSGEEDKKYEIVMFTVLV